MIRGPHDLNHQSSLQAAVVRSSSWLTPLSNEVLVLKAPIPSSSCYVPFSHFRRPTSSVTTSRRYMGTSSKNLDREVSIPPGAVALSFTTSQGPGGQNVNKVMFILD